MTVVMAHVIAIWEGAVGDLKLSNNRWLLDKGFLGTLIWLAVPCFIMISGSLLLNPERNINIDKIKRYILKMLYILVIFGFTYCLLENIFNYGFSNIFKLLYESIFNLFKEKSWSHMWYIYMLIGLYIITPILREFVKNANITTAKFVLLMLFILSIVIPTINTIFKIEITTFYLSSFTYIFMYLIGYYLVYTDIIKEKYIYIGGILGIIGYIMCMYFLSVDLRYSVFIILETMMIIKLFSTGKIKIKNNKVINCISKYSLGIYLVHEFWLNLLYKVCGIFPDTFPILIGELAIWLYALVLSIISSIILYKLPIIRKIW